MTCKSPIKKICVLEHIKPGKGWITCLYEIQGILIGSDQSWLTMQRAVSSTVTTEANALVAKYLGDAVVFTDGSVVCHKRCTSTFSAHSNSWIVQESHGAFLTTTSRHALEVVTMALCSLDTCWRSYVLVTFVHSDLSECRHPWLQLLLLFFCVTILV